MLTIIQAFIEHLVYTEHCLRHFRGMNFINLYNPEVGLAVTPFRGTERRDLLKVIEPGSRES